jgi:hypothetical protein
MSGIINGKFIPKGAKPRICADCRQEVFRLWLFSDSTEHYEFILLDCRGDGVRPTSRRGGVGKIHQCKKEESAA